LSISAPRYVAGPVALTARGARVLAIASREFFRRATWATLLAVALTYFGVVIIIVVNVFFASLLRSPSAGDFETPYESPVWPFLMLIVAASAGAGSFADDVGNRSISLYLARPIRLVDYVVAKTVACGGWLLISAVGPGLAGVAITAALGYASVSVLLTTLIGFIETGFVGAVFFTGLALALSSLANRALYSGVAIFGVVLVLYIGASVVAGITGNIYVPYANPIEGIRSVAHGAFGLSGTTASDPGAAAATLLGSGVVLWMFARWRMGHVEVISE
jgi:ABC-type transport system involved in multi-copper enzyme maturation permease subunit